MNKQLAESLQKSLNISQEQIVREEYEMIILEKTANELYYPSYLSFESALSLYGIISQIPYAITFATFRKSKRIILMGREIEYSKKFPESVQKLTNELMLRFGKHVVTSGRKLLF